MATAVNIATVEDPWVPRMTAVTMNASGSNAKSSTVVGGTGMAQTGLARHSTCSTNRDGHSANRRRHKLTLSRTGKSGWHRGGTSQTDRECGVVNEARRALCQSPKAQTGSQPDQQAVGGTLLGGWDGKGGWYCGGTCQTDRKYGVVNGARQAPCQSPKAQTGSQPDRSAPGWKGRRSDEGAMDSTRPRCSGILRISPHAQSPANFRTV